MAVKDGKLPLQTVTSSNYGSFGCIVKCTLYSWQENVAKLILVPCFGEVR